MQSSSFESIAQYYDGLVKLIFGNAIDEAQKAFFSLIPKDSSILIIGGGSGRILNDLIRKLQPKHITYIEASSSMLHRAEKRFQRLGNALTDQIDVNFFHGTEKEIPADQHYDVLMTFFLLDLYTTEEARELALILSAHLKPTGSWLFADFCVQGSTPRRYWQRTLLKIMYKFFQITSNVQNRSLPDYQQIFKELQCFPVQQKDYYHRFIVSTIYRKLLS